MRTKTSRPLGDRFLGRAASALLAGRRVLQFALFIGLILVGIGAIIVSQISWFDHNESIAHILQALGEALLIAGLLAAVADPIVQQRFAEEWGIGIFWAIFSRDAPTTLRHAVNQIAQPERYYAHSEWRIDLTWADDTRTVMVVDLVSHRRIVCVARDGWHPIDVSSGIVPDCDGNPSRFTFLEVNAKDWSVALDKESIEEYVSTDASGTANLEPKKIFDHHRVDYHDELVLTTGMQTRRRIVDTLPLLSRQTTLDWAVEVHGEAVEELFVELFGSNFANAGTRSEEPARWIFKSKKGAVTFPGHGLVLQWRPDKELHNQV